MRLPIEDLFSYKSVTYICKLQNIVLYFIITLSSVSEATRIFGKTVDVT